MRLIVLRWERVWGIIMLQVETHDELKYLAYISQIHYPIKSIGHYRNPVHYDENTHDGHILKMAQNYVWRVVS